MKRLLSILLALATPAFAQTTVNVTSTVINTLPQPRYFVNLSDEAPYSNQHHLRDMGVAVGGYNPGEYWSFTAQCAGGGTTTWVDNAGSNSAGYASGFFVGATYTAYNYLGTPLGTGLITGSTANTGGTPITFTLGTALSTACQNVNSIDMMQVRWFNSPDSLASPADIFSNISGSYAWNTTDIDPAAPSTLHTLQLNAGASLQLGFDQGLGNSTNTTSTASVSGLNINGTGYVYKVEAKCLAASGSGSLQLGLARGSTTYVSTRTVTPSCTNTAGSGYVLNSYSFNGSETGSQSGNLIGTISNTGSSPILVSINTVIEPTAMTPTNTTAYRDAVVEKLMCGTHNGIQGMCVGGLRDMDVATWGAWTSELEKPQGNIRWSSVSSYVKNNFFPTTAPTDFLGLCYYLQVDCWITIGQGNQGSDVASFINWLHTSNAWDTKFQALGRHIYIEFGNEAWNSSAAGNLWGGNGPIYANVLGTAVSAAHAAANWNGSVEAIIGDGRAAGAQGCSGSGWNRNLMVFAATFGTQPDILDVAPYTFNYWTQFTASGSNLSTTSQSLQDMQAEIDNYDLIATCSSVTSMPATNTYVTGTYGKPVAVYETNISDNQGTAAVNQAQHNQQSRSVATALAEVRHLMLMQDSAQLTGPISMFTLSENSNSYGCSGGGCVGGVVFPGWGINRINADGPGQTSGTYTVDSPQGILLGLVNNAIGTKTKVISTTATWPTYSYAGGQTYTATTSCGTTSIICANSAVRNLDCHTRSDGTNYAMVCFNLTFATSEPVTLTGNVPAGSVTETLFPPATNVDTDNNENTWVGATSAVVAVPTPTTGSGTSYTVPPMSALILTYSTSGSASPAQGQGITLNGAVFQ